MSKTIDPTVVLAALEPGDTAKELAGRLEQPLPMVVASLNVLNHDRLVRREIDVDGQPVARWWVVG